MNPPEFKQLIASLAEKEPQLARELQESMFDFEEFPALDIESRRQVVERLSPDVIGQSLAGAEPDLVEAFLSLLGSRTRRLIEQELRSAGKVDTTAVAAARQAVVAIIVQLLKEGSIVRPSANDVLE